MDAKTTKTIPVRKKLDTSPRQRTRFVPNNITPSEGVITPSSLQNKYQFLKQIGHGAQGKIFLARRLADNQEVAIKQLNISSVKNWKEYDLFHREAEVLASLNVYGIAKFYEAIECLNDKPPCSYIVQEYLPGRSMGELLNSGHRFSLDCVFDIILQLIDILYELHSHQPPVIHRDIKPSNILLQSTNINAYKVYLIDFGAVANPQVQGGGSTVAGTFGFMAPEQMMGNPCPASDIYSLAAVAVQLITGKSPADMPVRDFRLIFEPDMQQMSPALVATLRAMLEPKVENRLCDYQEIKERFESFSQHKIFESVGSVKIGNKSDYYEKLENVSSLCMPGNIELWQMLSEQTPREVPAPYHGIRRQFELYQNNTVFKEDSKLFRYMFISICVILLLVLGASISDAFMEFLLDIGEGLLTLLVVVFGFWPVIFLIAVISVKSTHKNKKYYALPPIEQEGFVYDVLDLLIKCGRKNIATITDIRYIPTPKVYIETKELMINKYYRKTLYGNHGLPTFEVSYKFNPPDDAREEDLVHTFLTHVEPEGHYQIGDPLPILYYIHHLASKEDVFSIPFPMPLNEIVSLYHVIGTSTYKFVSENSSKFLSENS